jgi:hypothetical protein
VTIACAAAAAVVAAPPAEGPEWTELKDAGALPDAAQKPTGIGALSMIHGDLDADGVVPASDYQDMYLVRIADVDAFLATTEPPVAGGFADFDTELWVFGIDEKGIVANDESPSIAGVSFLDATADDGSGSAITATGLYYIAISGHDSNAKSATGLIFGQATRTEISGPDGPGGMDEIDGWTPLIGETGTYTIRLRGVEFVNCPADFDLDDVVGFSDLLLILSKWGPCAGCPEDLDEDGSVDFDDLLFLLSKWGPCA